MIMNAFDQLQAAEKKEFITEAKNYLTAQFNSMSEGALKHLIGRTSQREELLALTEYIEEVEVDKLLRNAMFNHSKKKWVKNLREGN